MLFLFALCNITFMWGQDVKGKIVDGKDSSELSGVTIKILKSDSVYYSGTTTNAKGEFKFKIPFKQFYLIVSHIGYYESKLFVDNQDGSANKNLGNIIMHEATNSLDEVVVAASPIIEDLNKLVAYPTSKQLKGSVSGVDLLQNLRLTGLFVDPIQQKIEIQGTSGVIYRINGVNATYQQVAALKADEIERVEYAQTPSARELASNSGVINLILKKARTGTYLFADAVGAVSTGFINGNANIKTVFGKSELSLSYVVNWRDYSKRWSHESETYYYPTDTLILNKKGRYAPFGYLSQNINLGYTFNDVKNVLSIQFLNSTYASRDRNYIDVYREKPNPAQSFRNIYAKFDNYTPSLDLYYIRKINEQQAVEVNAVATLMNTDYTRSFVDRYPTHEYVINNMTDGHKKSVIFEGLYYHNKKAINYNVGVKGSFSDVHNTYESEKNRLKRLNLYPYASVDGKMKDIAYSIGTGVEMMYTNDMEKDTRYFRNLTTLSLFYKKNDVWSLRYTFRYTPSYPSLSDLNSIDQKQDSLIVIRGNPLLKPSQTINNKLTFTYAISKVRVTTGLSASKTFDAMGDAFFYDSNISSFVSITKNQEYNRRFGADMNIYLNSIFNLFSLSVGGNWDNYKTKGEGYVHKLNDLTWYVFGAMQLKDFTVDFGYRKPSRQLFGEMLVLSENYSSVGVTYKKKAFSVKTGLYYPFSSGTKYSTERKSAIAPSIRNVYVKDNANMFYVGLSYNISWGKSLFNVKKNMYNSDWDKGVLKINDN